MKFLRDLPIKRKLLWVTLATCGAALALACTALFWFQSVNFRTSFVAELESLGAVVAQNSAAPLAFEDKKSAVEVLSALKVRPHITSANVLDAQGKLFAHFGTEEGPGETLQARDAGQVTFDQGYAHLVLPITVQDAAPGRLQLRARFEDKYRELLSLYGLVLAAVLAGSLVVILIVSSAMQRIITSPIAALAEAARNVSEKEDYVTRAPEAGGDEVGLLTRAFNQMLDQIQSRDQRLRESQQRYEVAVMGSSDGLWDWDLVTNAVYYSPRWKAMLGYADEELANRFDTFRGLVHPEDLQRVLGRVESYLGGSEAAYEVEFRARHKDGGYRWILSRGAALRNAPEQVSGFEFGVSGLKFDGGVGVAGTRNSKLETRNPQPGTATAEGGPVPSSLLPRIQSDPQMESSLAGRFEFVGKGEPGKPVRFAGSHTDITERKQAEEEIRLAREKFETLVNSIDGVVWEADLKTSAFTFISAQAERLLGHPRRQWLEQPGFWADQIHPEDREATVRQYGEAAARRQALRCEYRMMAAHGREVWIRDISSVVEAPSGDLLRRGVLFDISDQKKAEQEREQLNRQLREASCEAGMAEIATGVLHNVGNVLNSVNVSAEVVMGQLRKSKTASLAKAVQLLREHQDDVGEFLSTDAKGKQLPAFFQALSDQLAREQAALAREMQGLQQNIEHIKQIVAMQQSYAKVSGALENLPPHELVEDALRMSSTALARHQIQVVRQFEAVPPVLVDRHKVLQILVNLVGNAKQALDGRREGRRLTLRIACGGEDRVRVEVTDNGMGIPQENLTRIFNHGFTTKKTGHGFGLHSGANAAKEMGGSLRVRSDGEGKGATFILELPLSKNAGQPSSPPADEVQKPMNRAA